MMQQHEKITYAEVAPNQSTHRKNSIVPNQQYYHEDWNSIFWS